MSRPLVHAYGDARPAVADDAYVSPNVSLIGDVAIGAESSIWFGAVLRGDVQPITIGARSSVQDNSVVHATEGWAPTTVGDDVTVGHMVILHGCTVCDRVVVGMGSIVMDAAEIGSDVILGAGSLVTTSAKIPPGVLALGRPARVIRELTDEERTSILESSAHYVEIARRYRRA